MIKPDGGDFQHISRLENPRNCAVFWFTELAAIGSVYGGLLTAFLLFQYPTSRRLSSSGGLVVDRLVQEKASGGRRLLQAGEER